MNQVEPPFEVDSSLGYQLPPELYTSETCASLVLHAKPLLVVIGACHPLTSINTDTYTVRTFLTKHMQGAFLSMLITYKSGAVKIYMPYKVYIKVKLVNLLQ